MKGLEEIGQSTDMVGGESAILLDVLLGVPGVIRFEECDPAQVLGQLTRGEPLAPTCVTCGKLLPRGGDDFKKCPCSVTK